MLKQLNVYAENKKGTLEKITRILLEHDINILGSMSDDGAEFGINRMVVSDPKTAAESLQKAGINVQYLYLSFNRDSGLPIMVFSADDIWEVEDGLKNRGYQVV